MGNDLIDQAVFFCLLCGHIVIALGIQLDLFQRLTRVLAEHPVHLIADIHHVFSVDLDISGLAGQAAALTACDQRLISALGSAKRLPLVPLASRKAPMEAAMPMQMVETSHLIYFMVS